MTIENQEKLTKKQLKKLIKETKRTLTQLETELKVRKQESRHDDVDHIDEQLQSAGASLFDIKKLIDAILKK